MKRWAALLFMAVAVHGPVSAQTGRPVQTPSTPQLDAKFSCSVDRAQDVRRDGRRSIYADNGEFHLRGDRVDSFRWESSLFRSTHGFDCSIDDSDGVQAELLPTTHADSQGWRVRLRDARAARTQRGYDADHGLNCSIRIIHAGDMLQIIPSCPALCGSRENFSALTVDLKSGRCTYED